MSDPAPLARMTPNPTRRYMAMLMLGGLALIFLYLAAKGRDAAGGLPTQLALGAAGLAALWLLGAVRRATARALVLTATGDLRESGEGGRLLARLDQMEAIERGTFAFKPSHGFLLRLRARGPRGWAPGLWWAVGRQIGVGGVTSATEGKQMAEAITMLLVQRAASGADAPDTAD